MTRAPLCNFAAGLLALLALSGCAHRGGRCYTASYDAGGSIESLPEVARGAFEPGLGQVPDFETLDRALDRHGPFAYRGLTPAQAQCLAAAESTLGNLISAERSALQPRGGRCHNNERSVAVMRR